MSSLLDALIAAEEFPPLKGDRGPKGDVGDKGEKGDTGYQGLEGPAGPMGPDGPKGDQGPEGPIGKDGKRGPKGEKGDKGDEGPAGKDGAAMGIAGGGRGSYNVRGFASGMVIDDEGTKLNGGSVVGEIDFAGAGVTTALVGSKAVVTIPGTSGSGLPSQWSTGTGHGDVTATVDDPDGESTPLTVKSDADQGGSTPTLLVEDADGEPVLAVLPGGQLNVTPTDISLSKLAVIRAPTGYRALGADGQFLSVVDEDDFEVGRLGDGSMEYNAAPDMGQATVALTGTDAPADRTFIRSGGAGGGTGEFDRLDIIVGGVHVVEVDFAGNTILGRTSAPADAALSASQVGIWFDDTNGAASPKWKGKSADGTVVTGSLGGGTPSFLSSAKWGTD